MKLGQAAALIAAAIWAALIAVTICIALPAHAQRQPVFQDGIVMPNHLVKQGTDGLIKDVGEPAIGDAVGQGVSPFGVNDKLNPLGVVTYSADPTVDGSYIALGHDAAGVPTISVGATGGASAPGCNFAINGSVVPCVGTGSLTAVTPTGASTPSTVGDLFSRSMSVLDFGAKCDGSTNDAAAIQAAITWAQSTSGGALPTLPPGKTCAIAATLAITAGAVGLACPSNSTASVGGNGCELKWIGAAGGRMMSIISPFGSTGNKRLERNTVRGIRFNGNGLAADGLYLASLFEPQISDLSFVGGFNGGSVLNLDIIHATQGTDFGETTSMQKGVIANIHVANTGFTSNAIKMGAYRDPNGVWGNVDFMGFSNLELFTSNTATALLCVGCDNIWVDNLNIDNGNGVSVDLSVAVDGANLFAANGNVLRHVNYSGSLVARGQTTFATCAAVTNPTPANPCTWANDVQAVDKTNGTADPTIETGAQLTWSGDWGNHYGHWFQGKNLIRPAIYAIDDFVSTNTCAAELVANVAGARSSLFYGCATLSGPAFYYSNGSGSSFKADFSAQTTAGNFRFRRAAGSGVYNFADAPVLIDGGGLTVGSSVASAPTAGQLAVQNGILLPVAGPIYSYDNGGTTPKTLLQRFSDNKTYLDGGTAGLVLRDNDGVTPIGTSNGSGGFSFTNTLSVVGLPASAGAGGLNVCVDTAGVFYKKASCP